MLQIKEISKTYKTGTLVQRALNGVSLALRDNEFVAILGQSGSGKTTLLNIIGGLDRYDSGDLIIDGVSTKKYGSRDWDAYRNHSVGFVFQSYNLIPHQTILANVELALTIGGVSRRERTARAKEALDKVGLSEHIHKKPNQLSGGQMQRVAIARALVNDPKILLADEPTGALDSETSLQVMDLLKEVARDRLVVMVTHNPELAEKYATRIVRLRDGEIIADSDPYTPDETEGEHKRIGRSSMSLLTALNLSLNNLWTKKVRTLLVAFAGSIGIIGIALILSMSHGVDVYINNVEEETLKSYPLEITGSGFNFASLMARDEEIPEDDDREAQVREWNMMTTMFSHVTKNDLRSLREYIESGATDIYDNVQAVEYTYGVTPQIYTLRDGKTRRVNPDGSFAALGFSSGNMSQSSLMSSFSSTDTFHPLPADPDIYAGGYDVKAGRWPQEYNECVLVLTRNGFVSDLALYTMGFKDPTTLDELVRAFSEGRNYEVDTKPSTYKYDDFIGTEFRLVSAADLYTYDSEFNVWTNHAEDAEFVKKLVGNGEKITVVGVVQPAEGNDAPILQVGLGYPASLVDHVIDLAADSEIVKAQLAAPETDVFTGVKFGEEADHADLDMSTLFNFDEEALSDAFDFSADDLDFSGFDLSSVDLSNIDMSGAIDTSALSDAFPQLSDEQISQLFSSIKFDVSAETMESLFGKLLEGYVTYAASDPTTDYSRLGESVSDFLTTEEAAKALQDGISAALAENANGTVSPADVTSMLADILSGFPAYVQEHGIGEGDDPSEMLNGYLQTPEVQTKISAAADALRASIAAVTLTSEQISAIATSLYSAYDTYAQENDLPAPSKLADSFSNYLSTDSARELILSSVSDSIDTSELEKKASELFSGYADDMSKKLSGIIGAAMSKVGGSISDAITRSMSGMTQQFTDKFSDALKFDPETLADAFKMNMSPDELRDLFNSLMSTEVANYDGNIRKLGYADEDDPSSITIYPSDFESKTRVKAILDGYNSDREAAGEDDKVIVYTDVVDTLMSSVTQIVDAISGVLIGFVAISLVVSSVMIGVITYISVLERRKEIGILRAIGASKRNISNVFNAETFIIGALAGVLGIVISVLLIIPINYIIHTLTGQTNISAVLPPVAAILLIVLSIVLTLIGGIIPSRKAARSDPVTALRSE